MRSISQIYSEAVSTRNDYLQLTELNSGRSNSKLSIMNLLTYVVAVCIHSYEVILDIFQLRLAEVINGRINGTPDWYASISKKFQYNPLTERGDELFFNEDTLKLEYVNPDTSHRIITQSAWQNEDNALLLKVCKTNTNSNETQCGIPYMPLSDKELTAFRMYIQQMKFVGADVYCESAPGDIVTIVADAESPIFYNDNYVTETQAMQSIQKALYDFAANLDFNGMLYYQAIIDAIRKAEHIEDVSSNVRIYVTSYNTVNKVYNEPVELKNRIRLHSGYIRFMDDGAVITVNDNNLTLRPSSQMNESSSSSGNCIVCGRPME